MINFPKLTEADVRAWTGHRDFERGHGYYRSGNIQHPQQQGLVLKAQCFGSMSTPYRVQVTLTESGIGEGGCSCPVGYRCKHTVALLLTWIHNPATFTETEDLLGGLEKRNKEDLIALIQKMLERAPELESLLELQALSEATAANPISPDVIRRQVSRAMASGGDKWGAGYEIQRNVQDIVATGTAYVDREDWRNAVTVYVAVATTVLDEYETVYDDEGEVLSPVYDCVNGLEQCLRSTKDSNLRTIILRALFDVYRWDVNFGGVGLSDDAPGYIIAQATPDEKAQVAAWVREYMPRDRGDKFTTHWRSKAYGGFLLDLEAHLLDDEAYLRICRATGRTTDYLNRLLNLERIAQAVTTAQQIESDYELLSQAHIFTQHGYEDDIYHLIVARTENSTDSRLREWLRDYAQRHQQPEKALALAEELFWMRPALAGYQELQMLADPIQEWESVRLRTLNRLAQDSRQATLLIHIHLMEKDAARALQVLQSVDRYPQNGYGMRVMAQGLAALRIQVAQAAEPEFPNAAIEIYTRAVFGLIEARGRENYATVAQHLLRLRALYAQIGDPGRFTSLLQNLRHSNKQLRALKDELRKAGL